jgi:hypothetical protein
VQQVRALPGGLVPSLSPTARRWSPAVAGLVVVGAAFALPLHGGTSTASSPRLRIVASALPTPQATGIVAVSGEQPPGTGQARLVAGPFTDRLRLLRLTLVQGAKPQVQGEFAQRFDNSALLDMEVQADFYAADGTLLGSKRRVLRQPDVIAAGKGGTGDQRFGGNIVFSVEAPTTYAKRVAGVLVSVPVLVNE